MNWLSRELGKKGIKAWVDEGEILVGDSLIGKIEEGISKTNFFAVILSKNSVRSRWVKTELEMAFVKEFKKEKVFILPVVIEDCEIPLYIERKRYADFRNSYEKGLHDILQVLVGKSHFQCMLFRQKKPAIFLKGHRQRVTITNYSEVDYTNDVPVIVRKKVKPNECFFGINVKNLTDQTKKNVKIKVSFKFVSSGERIHGYLHKKGPNTQIISGGIDSNFVCYNISLLHPYDEHRFGLAANTDQWPDIDITCESCIWNGRINKMDVIPQELERANFPSR